jgi:hypothetical protein
LAACADLTAQAVPAPAGSAMNSICQSVLDHPLVPYRHRSAELRVGSS